MPENVRAAVIVGYPCHHEEQVGQTVEIGKGVRVHRFRGHQIGDRVLVGANCTIADNDFHPLPAGQRQLTMNAAVEPISIGDDVFIGMNSLILKGVSIGARSVIGAGSVVTADVPADVVEELTPREWKKCFADCPLRSDLDGLVGGR